VTAQEEKGGRRRGDKKGRKLMSQHGLLELVYLLVVGLKECEAPPVARHEEALDAFGRGEEQGLIEGAERGANEQDGISASSNVRRGRGVERRRRGMEEA